MVSLAYDSVSRIAPDVVSDPLMGGQFIKDIALRGHVDVSGMKTLHEIHRGNPAIANEVMRNVGSAIKDAPNALTAARNSQLEQAKHQAEMALLPHKHQLEMQRAQHELTLFPNKSQLETNKLQDELREYGSYPDSLDVEQMSPATAKRLLHALETRNKLDIHPAVGPLNSDGISSIHKP
jgi:hypothetical protein